MLTFTTRVCAESNDSLEALANAQETVQRKLDEFAKDSNNFDVLLVAQKLSASLNPRGDKKKLSRLDEACLRLQLKVLLSLAGARDRHFDRKIPANRVFLNVSPPLANGTGPLTSGMEPNSMKDLKARKVYEEAIAENHKRTEKLKREMALSRGMEYALIHVWVFVKQGFPKDSAAQKRAIEIVHATIPDEVLLDRFNSDKRPSITW